MFKAWNEDFTLESVLVEIKKEMIKTKKLPQPSETATY
jgi:hypothetical protein